MVREAIAELRGAEIRTEGDSFFVVFPSPSLAVRAALATVERAEADADRTRRMCDRDRPQPPFAVQASTTDVSGSHNSDFASARARPCGSSSHRPTVLRRGGSLRLR
jgi:class 3 adenylate cyclase